MATSALTETLRTAIAKLLLDIAPFAPTSVSLALYTAVADADVPTATEVPTLIDGDTTGYVRLPLVGSDFVESSTPGQCENAATLQSNEALQDWGTITHAGLVFSDGVTTWLGRPVELAQPKTVITGERFKVPVGGFRFTVT